MRQSLRGHPQALENVEVNTPYEIPDRADIAIFVEEAPIDAPPADGDGADLVPAGGRIRKRRSPRRRYGFGRSSRSTRAGSSIPRRCSACHGLPSSRRRPERRADLVPELAGLRRRSRRALPAARHTSEGIGRRRPQGWCDIFWGWIPDNDTGQADIEIFFGPDADPDEYSAASRKWITHRQHGNVTGLTFDMEEAPVSAACASRPTIRELHGALRPAGLCSRGGVAQCRRGECHGRCLIRSGGFREWPPRGLIRRATEAAGLDGQWEQLAKKKSPEQLARRLVLLTRERRELRKRLGDA